MITVLPDVIYIAGRKVAVVMKPDLAATTGNVGEATYQPPTLTIDSNVPEEMMLEVFMHEVLHHIDEAHGNVYGFNIDENKCKALGIALAAVMEQL